MSGKFGTPHRDPHARAGLGDGADEMAADKARAPVDGDERLVVENDGHLCPLSPSRLAALHEWADPCEAPRAHGFLPPGLSLALIDFRKPGSYLRDLKPRWRNW